MVQTDPELLTKMAVLNVKCLHGNVRLHKLINICMLVKVNGFEGTSNVLVLPRTHEVSLSMAIIIPYTRTHTTQALCYNHVISSPPEAEDWM